jgi:hydroxymethylglutaryl-CoA synthase
MVSKTVLHLGERLGLAEKEVRQLLAEKVDPTMEWNRRTGNAYTASLWVAVARALAGATEGDRLAAFSYGSGFGAELLTLSAGPRVAEAPWAADAEADFAARERIDVARYEALRGARVAVGV